MKKNSFLFPLLLALLISSLNRLNAQAKNSSTLPSNIVVYRNAIRCNDYLTAIIALNYHVAQSRSTDTYRDSLAVVYYLSGAYQQCIYWCEELLKSSSDKRQLIEIKAASLKNTGRLSEAIHDYEKLMSLSPEPVYAYNLMELQYQLKRYHECLLSSRSIESFEYKPEHLLSYNTTDNTPKRTNLKSAMYNLRGLSLYQTGKLADSKIAFELALMADSTNLLAADNLRKLLSESDSETTKSNSTPVNKSEPKKEE